MSNDHQIVLFRDGETFSTYYFYNKFLPEIAKYFQDSNDNADGLLSYKLISGEDFVMGKYRIDPIAIPLLLSLSQQIAFRQKSPIWLDVSNIPSTISLLEFLYRSDFFYVAGDNLNPCFPIGKKIIAFNKNQIGGFQGKNIRPEHKIRCYSRNDGNEKAILHTFENEEKKRDYLVEHYSYEVSNHFQSLLQEFSNENIYFYIEVLSELITNGVMHSETDVFALMFSDRFSIKFSIADNGIGFAASLSKKEDMLYYKKFDLENQILNDFKLPSNEVIKALLSIFETLFFSMTKSRLGLFDLVLSVVYDHFGYFRLHNDYAQVIVSARMLDELTTLNELRKEIRKVYSLRDYGRIEETVFDQKMKSIIYNSKVAMIALFRKMWDNYNEDVRFSSVRFFPIRFRGVHIEAEIPK